MLSAAVVLLTAATVLLGVASLLLGETQDRAFAQGVEASTPDDVDVDAFLVDLAGPDLEDTRAQAQDLVRDVLAPMDPTLVSSASSRMRSLDGTDGTDGQGYLGSTDAFDRRAELTSGRWPADQAAGPPEAVVPDAAASKLGLALGDEVTLGAETGIGGIDEPVTVVVVGSFRPRVGAGWDSDPLSGAGFAPAYSDGNLAAPAYGPFVVTDAALLASGSNVSGVRVTAHPDLRLATDPSLRAAAVSLDGASALLSARVGDQVHITRVASDLPATLARIHAEQATTRSTVLVVLLLGFMLSLAALLLVGRLVGAVRDDERALLVGLGLGRRQQLGAALLETLLLAAVSVLLAVPAAASAHSLLTHLPAMRAAGLSQGPTVTGSLVLTVAVAAVLLTLALVVPALDTGATGTPSRRRAAARSGVDLLLLVVAAAAWWELRSQPATAETSGDLALTVAPVLWLVCVTAVAVRAVPVLLALVATAGSRAPSLVLPLAATQAARRPHTGTAMVLLATAVAAATFGTALHATWERSQVDQAAMRVGTDLTLTLPAPATPEEAAAVLAATKGSVASAVTAQPLTLGRYVGDVGSPPVLVATDSRHAGDLLRGRLDGTTWGSIGAALSPATRVEGVPLPEVAAGDGRAVELTGESPAGVTLSVTPTVVVQDDAGFRSAVSAAPVRLDGRPHPVRWQRSLGPGEVVAVHLEVDGVPGDDPGQETVVPVDVELRVPGVAASAGDPAWQVRSLGDQTPVRAVSVVVRPTSTGVVLRTSAQLDLSYLAYIPADLLATAFEAPTDIPVAVSQRLADQVGAEVGGEISATVGGAVLPLRVTAIVPTVPSAPGRIAVLADQDVLSRALISAGRVEPLVNGWWVADPPPPTVRALRALQLGDIATRDEATTQLAEGPLRVTVPAALVMLVVAGLALLLAGAGLLVSADQRRRSAEVARLRALGLTRRGARRLLLAEHVMFLGPLVLVGVLVGAAAAVLLGPGLIRSDVGAAPVPDAVVVWPWPAEAALVGGVLVACVVIAAVVSALHVRRAGAAQLRVGDS